MSNIGTEKTRKPLGRGLSSLLPPRPAAAPAVARAAEPNGGVLNVAIEAIHPNPVQPRTIFRPERLEELAASIRANGIIQPLIVRQVDGQYQIIAGERRWRAAKLAALTEVPVIVQDVADRNLLQLALIENIQREDLNPIETALAYDRLSRELGMTQEEIAQSTGKARTSVTNTIRLLGLPKEVQQLLAENRLSAGHARPLLALDTPEDQIRLAEKAAAQGLNARQVEELVREETMRAVNERKSSKTEEKLDPNVEAALEELRNILQTKVKIVETTDQRGRIEIQYYSQDDLQRIYERIVEGPRPA